MQPMLAKLFHRPGWNHMQVETSGASIVDAVAVPDPGIAAAASSKRRARLIATDSESRYRSGQTRSWIKVKIRR
jgi:hypothetical protein